MRATATRKARKARLPTISARLSKRVSLDVLADGTIAARFSGHSIGLGTFSAGAADHAQQLRAGLPLDSFVSRGRSIDKEIDRLVRRLARHGLLEYRLGRSQSGEDLVVIEPQLPDYWPRMRQLRETEILVLSRFAYMRRRANEMVLESPLRRRFVQDLRSKDRGHRCHAVHAAARQTAASARRLSRGRVSGFAAGLPNPFQDRCCRRQRTAAGRRR